MLIYENIEKHAIKNEDKICMIHDNNSITYGEFVKRFVNISKALSVKWTTGQKIIIKHSDPIQQITFLLAAAKSGLSSVLVDYNIKPEVMNNLLEKINPHHIIDNSFIIPAKLGRSPIVLDKNIFLGALSSGSTGQHKLIWRDHQSWTSAFQAQSNIFSISSEDTLFLCGSLVYTANLNSALHILNEGGRVIFSDISYPRTWIKEIQQNNVTSIFMVPSHYRILVKNMKTPFCQINSIVSAGEKLDKETAADLIRLFPKAEICEYYGASELGHVSYAKSEQLLKGDSVGKPFPGVKLWIEDEEIWIKSPYLAPEYRPKATVGDLGKLDEEGNLQFLGRKNDIINKGGVKILPSEVEKILNNHPQIAQAVAFGIKHSIKGEQVAAVIVKKDSDLTFEKVISFCRNYLNHHACPQRIMFVNNMPMNGNSKVNKNVLKALFMDENIQ